MSAEQQCHPADQYSNAVDGLRAFAVVAVIINHFDGSLLSSGYLGVDIFFVISGFVITASLAKRGHSDARSFFFGFYRRRIKRLLPALLLLFGAVAILISFFNLYPRSHILTGLYSIPGLSNLYLYWNSVDYWGSQAELNPFTHTWSLGVEEQFYMLFPLLVFLTTRNKWTVSALRRLRWVLLVCSLLSLASFVYYRGTHTALTYFMMPFRFWEMGLGCLLYLQLKLAYEGIRKLLQFLPLLFLLGLIVTTLFMPHHEGSPFTTVAIVFLTLALIAKVKCEPNKRDVGGLFLRNDAVVYIGKISYSLYLWHWPVIVLSKWTIGVNALTIPFQVILTFLLSIVSYYLIENPLRYTRWRAMWQPKLVLAPMFACAVLFFYIAQPEKMKNRLYLGAPKSVRQIEDYTSLFDDNLTENIQISKIQILGNSHSSHILPMLDLLAEQYQFEVIRHKDPDYILIPNGDRQHIHRLDEVLSTMDRGDLLVLSGRYRYLYQQPYLNVTGDRWLDHMDEKAQKGYGLEVWLEELDMLLAACETRGINVVSFLPNVEFDQPVPPYEYVKPEWFRIESEEHTTEVSAKYLNGRFPEEYYDALYQRAKIYSNFFTFNPLPVYWSDGGAASRHVDGIVAFTDTNHLTSEGAMLMLDEFYNFMLNNKLL